LIISILNFLRNNFQKKCGIAVYIIQGKRMCWWVYN